MAFVEERGRNSWRVRYPREDGTLGSISGFTSYDAANDKALEIELDQRRGKFFDPAAGKLAFADWSDRWLDSIDVADATMSQYKYLIRKHILPRWGSGSLDSISNLDVHTWVNKLRAKGYATSTVATIVKIMSMMLADAADDGLLPANPIRPRRRGRRRHQHRPERRWATPEQALGIAVQAALLVGPWAAVLMITAAWTGARWGELTGLQRCNLHLDAGILVVDPDIGALHEVDGNLTLGPPKTEESARTILLPPFLRDLLRAHLNTHDHPHVFVTAERQLLRRSNFARRAMRPAADGNLHRARPRVRVQPIVPRLTFHGFRHSHKTWMIADGIPEVAQAQRLGHKLPDKIEHIYSHVAPEVEARLLDALQHRWTTAVTNLMSANDASGHRLELPGFRLPPPMVA